MALTTRGILLERFSIMFQSKRFRGKVNIQRPKPVHFERAVVMELTKPWFINPKKGKPLIELCTKSTEKKVEVVDNPYERIIARELKDLLDTSKLVVFYHLNPIDSDKRYKAYVMFKKANMEFKNYARKTLELAVKNTKYESVLDFYVSHNMTVFSPELEVKKMLKITKKFPQLVLLAAIFEGKFISKDELMELELIPNLQTAQANLVQTLNTAACTLTQQLQSHQSTLVSQLQQRVKQLEENE